MARIDTEIDYQNAFGAGTGIVLDPGGQVLTNYHVVQGPTASAPPSRAATSRPS